LQAEDGIRDRNVTGVQTCALPIYLLPVFLTKKICLIWSLLLCMKTQINLATKRSILLCKCLKITMCFYQKIKFKQKCLSKINTEIGRASCRETEKISRIAL